MVAKAKKSPPVARVVPAAEANSHISKLVGRLGSRGSSVQTATDMLRNQKYIDLIDPKTGLPCITLMWLFGARGMACGRISVLRALYSKGKTSFCMLMYGAAQRKSGGICYHVETEGAAPPPDRILALGANPNELLLGEHNSLEECLKSIDEVVCEVRGGFGGSESSTGRTIKTVYTDPIDAECVHPMLIGVDSLSALAKQDRAEKDVIDVERASQIAATARIMREFFRERAQRYHQKNVTLLLTAQQTTKLETGFAAKFSNGQPKKTSIAEDAVGNAGTYGFDFESSPWTDKHTGDKVGDIIRITSFKNKMAPRYRQVELYLSFTTGFDLVHTDVEFLTHHPASPFADGHAFGNEEKLCFPNTQGNIVCRPLREKPFKSEEEFLREFYSNEAVFRKCAEYLRLYGYGFPFEAELNPFWENGEENDKPEYDIVDGPENTPSEEGE